MKYKIFLSYRKAGDSLEASQKIYAHLTKVFGIESIKQEKIGEVLFQDVYQCDCLVANIGKDWLLTTTIEQENEHKIAISEIAIAFEREILVLPILLDDANIPSEKDLPPSIYELAYKNGICVRSDNNFENDMKTVIQTLCQFFEIPDLSEQPRLYEKGCTSCDNHTTLPPTYEMHPNAELKQEKIEVSKKQEKTEEDWQSFLNELNIEIDNSSKIGKQEDPILPLQEISLDSFIFPQTIIEYSKDTPPTQLKHFFELISIRFFEDGEQASEAEQRQYQTEFIQHITRYVYCEVKVSNLLYKKQAHTHSLLWKYSYSDGRLINEISAEFPILPNWYSAWHQHGIGWKNPGNWLLGDYLVTIHCDGQLLGQEKFSIIEKLSLPNHRYANQYFELISIRFFESGDNVSGIEAREYTQIFEQNKTRYIYCEVKIMNLLYRQNSHTHRLAWKYYKPDGTLWGKIEADFTILSEWYTAWHQRGCGWSTPGNWESGKYLVKIYSDDDFIGEDTFTITHLNCPSI